MGCCGSGNKNIIRSANKSIAVSRPAQITKPRGMRDAFIKKCPKCGYVMSRFAKYDPSNKTKVLHFWTCTRFGCRYSEKV